MQEYVDLMGLYTGTGRTQGCNHCICHKVSISKQTQTVFTSGGLEAAGIPPELLPMSMAAEFQGSPWSTALTLGLYLMVHRILGRRESGPSEQ